MNCSGKYLKVWEVEDKGNVKLVNLGDSRKNKQGEFENCTWFRCLFVGDASRKQIAVDDKIEILSGQVFMEKYNEKWSPKVTVFDFNVMQQGSANSQNVAQNSAPQKERFEDDIPF